MSTRRDDDGGMPPKHPRIPTTPDESSASASRSGDEPTEAPATNASAPALAPTPMQAPTPTLPTGGGAIRSIGERPSVNPATGAGSMSIALAAPPGRAGFGPGLGLAYSSGTGNGPFGLGWSLTVPFIGRKTDKGIPRYLDDEDSDVFVLSGLEDLVPLLEVSGDPTHRESYGRPATEEVAARVRYRPRVESEVVWLERVTELDTNGRARIWWESCDGAGVRRIYGRSAMARVADPNNEARIFQWLLEEVSDPRGHIVRFEHKPEDLKGVTGPAEAHRLAAHHPPAGSYLKRVRYGHRAGEGAPGPEDFHFEVVFDYGEHDGERPSPAEEKDWPVRKDPFSTYRAGFEIRTYRLCRRVLAFHRFPDDPSKPGASSDWPALLVTATELEHHETEGFTYLTGVTHRGFGGEAEPGAEASLPPVAMSYSAGPLSDKVHTVSPDALEQLPAAVDGRRYQWIDLDGEGIAGVLSQEAGALHYKRNLGEGRLAPSRVLRDQPSGTAIGAEARPGDGQRLLDVTGDGLPDLVSLDGPAPGFHSRTADGSWEPARPFRTLPNVDWSDANLRFIDLDGDGFADVLISSDHVYTWYPAIRGEGYGPPRQSPRAVDDSRGPTLVFSEAEQTVFLADMSGDGLTDLVRIRNGEVSYWPNLGHGRFGVRVTMQGAPVFAPQGTFDPARLRLADIDGSGTTDLVYVDGDGVHLWANQSGNGFGARRTLAVFPDASELSTFDVIDILGRGTACLVWSTDLPGFARAQLRYVDIHGGDKPHLLKTVDNGLGLLTKLDYGTSTRHYLADRAAGRRWVTRLPFPVQVVDRIEHYDAVARHRFVATYRYAHGYYDVEEREFRGFGYVEQRDAESVDDGLGNGLFPDYPIDNQGELPLPPVVTKSWFHTGARLEEEALLRAFEDEWFDPRRIDASVAAEPRLPSLPHEAPWALSPPERHQAHRALAGALLRQEVYAEDGTPQAERPYMVRQQSHRVRALQPTGSAPYAVFRLLPAESLALHYERGLSHPRMAHDLTLVVDELGYPRATAHIAYGRTGEVDDDAQRRTWVRAQTVDLHHAASSGATFRHGIPLAERHYELSPSPQASPPLWSIHELAQELQASTELAFDALSPGAPPTTGNKRLLGHSLQRYWDAQRQAPLPFGDVPAAQLILPHSSYAQAFTPRMLTDVLGGRVDETALREAGYLSADDLRDDGATIDDDGWWAWSGVTHYEAAVFFAPNRVVDPHGQATTVAYDPLAFAPVETVDPLGNTTKATLDYRVLAPRSVEDPNGTMAKVRFDALGRVVATRIAKGSDGDLTEDTSTTSYELLRWTSAEVPARFVQARREVHQSEVTAARPNRWLTSWTYATGSGAVALVKAEAEPGPVPQRDAQGRVVLGPDGFALMTSEDVEPRYIASGRTVVDNKGNPIKQYEPYFSRSPGYDAEEALEGYGVTAIVHYDPLGRAYRSDLPDGTFTRSTWSPWNGAVYDANDTAEPGQRWYDEAIATASTDLRHRAAVKSSAHADTPSRTYADALGRPVVAVAQYRHDNVDQLITTRSRLDISGNTLAVEDALGRTCMTYAVDMLGRMLRNDCIDAGRRTTFPAVGGEALLTWGERNQLVRSAYDELRRPTHQWLHDPAAGAGQLVQRLYYGEAHPDVVANNLRGKLVAHFDQAGAVVSERYDFKGHPLETRRRLTNVIAGTVDWSTIAAEPNPKTALSLASSSLEGESFTQTAAYDALGRAYTATLPDDTRIERSFNRAGLLASVEAWLRGASSPTTVVHAIDYDEKGRRKRIERADDGLIVTHYEYDSRTFRLTRLTTTRPQGDPTKRRLQDLRYSYDAAGLIVRVEDHAQPTIFFGGDVVLAHGDYTYDSLYRLIQATGREHHSHQQQRDENQPTSITPMADAAAMRNYVERYDYDLIGNIVAFHHGGTAAAGDWTRRYHYLSGTNRLHSTSTSTSETAPYARKYEHDAHGNMTRMPHLELIEWDHLDQMRHVRRAADQDLHLRYDAAGQRVRKVWESSNLRKERIYLGAYEIYRETTISTGALQTERQTAHLSDDQSRICMVETKTVSSATAVSPATPRQRFQLDNHLGTCAIEVDEVGALISYEEYHPYGTSAYRAHDGSLDVSAKRYRYTGKERDEETGLYYHGARYYAPWLGRWTAADPLAFADGVGSYTYVRGDPIGGSDPTGRDADDLHRAPTIYSRGISGTMLVEQSSEPPRGEVSYADGADPAPKAKPKASAQEGPSLDDLIRKLKEVDASEQFNRKLASQKQVSPSSGPEEGVYSVLEGAIAGGFSENDTWSAIAGQTVVSFVPYFGQAADARDIIAAGVHVSEGKEGSGWELAGAIAGVVPGLGDAAKAVIKKVAGAGATAAVGAVLTAAQKRAAKAFAKLPQAGELARLRQAANIAAGDEGFTFAKFEAKGGGEVFGANKQGLVGDSNKTAYKNFTIELAKEQGIPQPMAQALVHAEAHALLRAFDQGLPLEGGRLYVDNIRCDFCMGKAGLPRVLRALGVEQITLYNRSNPAGVVVRAQ